MPNSEPTNDQLQAAIESLLEQAERCYRLARGTTDRQTIEALLRIAEECEERVAELRQQTSK